MATTPKTTKDAEPEAEPAGEFGTEIAALRADMRDLAQHVASIGKARASGLKSVRRPRSFSTVFNKTTRATPRTDASF